MKLSSHDDPLILRAFIALEFRLFRDAFSLFKSLFLLKSKEMSIY